MVNHPNRSKKGIERHQFTIAENHHAPFVIAVEQHGDLPVLIHKGGHYPSLLDLEGKRIDTLIVATLYDDYFQVSALSVFDYVPVEVGVGKTPDLDGVRALYPAAAQAIMDAPALHAEARRLKALYGYGTLTRQEYDALATELGFPPLPDSELSEWGVFEYPRYPLADLPSLWIGQRRALGFKAEAAARLVVARAEAHAAMARAATGPVLRTETKFVACGLRNVFTNGRCHCTVIARSGRRRIDDGDPSVHGSHLLGHEGDYGEDVTIEVRSL